jgi:hypothetical protein
MAYKAAGSIRKVILDGISYVTAADSNISEIGSAYENSSVPTSGVNMRKMVRRTELRENIVLIVDDQEREALRELSDRLEDIPMSYETAGGSTFRADGWIEFENRETEENRATIKMIPRRGWDLFS